MRTGVFGLLILAGLLLLAAQPATGIAPVLNWQIETVQSSAAAGQPSMAVDPQRGEIHVSYYSLADGNGELRYAHEDRSGWHRSTVDTGGSANVGQASAIALRNGFPVIAYVDATNHALKFAEFSIVGGWTVSTLVGPGSGRTIAGCPAILALPDGDVVITCWDTTSGAFVSEVWDHGSGSWSMSLVDTSLPTWFTEDPAPSMVLDYRLGSDHPTPGVIYSRKISGQHQVQYSWYDDRVSGMWAHDAYFDSSKGMARDHGSAVFRYVSPGTQSRFWCDTAADGQLWYGSDGQYDFSGFADREQHAITADGIGLYAYYTSLALHPCNLSSIAYTDPTINKLMYAWNDGFWHRSVVDSLSDATGATNRPTLALDGSGNPIICYYSDSAGEVRIARTGDAYPAIPAAKSYEPYLALVLRQAGSSGCGFFSYLHATEILKEMEVPYTPDPSFQFTHYIWWLLLNGTARGFTNPNVPDPSLYLHDHDALEIFGHGLETDYPSNYDRFGTDLGTPEHWVTAELQNPPTDQAFANAANYRLADHSDAFWRPSVETAERLLAVNGPLICYYYHPNHVIAIIGYDRDRREFTIADSFVYKVSYEAFNQRMVYDYWASSINAVRNRETPLLHPYTARINVTIPHARSYLEASIGAVGHPPLVVWNQNNRYSVGMFDWNNRLKIDVALPAYAADHYPPSDANPWYVTVVDHDPNTGSHVVIDDVTLVRRQSDPRRGGYLIDTYEAADVPAQVPSQGTSTVFVPGTARVTAVPGGAGVPMDTNADGLWDDVNGNGRRDFADVVLYFSQMAWIAANEPVAAFDYNGNGRIDFADVVWLFSHL